MSSTDSINALLCGVSTVRRIEFECEPRTGRCSLQLDLVDDDVRPTQRRVLRAEGVTNWCVANLGGGLRQLGALRASDVSHLQHDRVRYLLEERERGALRLSCAHLSVKAAPLDP
jgi:hypothetical protein